MEKIEGKKDHFMIRVSKTDIEIRRIKDKDDDDDADVNELINFIVGSENRPEYTWQYFNEIRGEWDYLFVKTSGIYNQYTQENLELQYQREHKLKRILNTN